jgi:hypothetical protein
MNAWILTFMLARAEFDTHRINTLGVQGMVVLALPLKEDAFRAFCHKVVERIANHIRSFPPPISFVKSNQASANRKNPWIVMSSRR